MGSILEYKYETDTENFYDCKFWSLVFVKDDLSELFLLCVLMLFLYIGVIFLLHYLSFSHCVMNCFLNLVPVFHDRFLS